MNDESAIHDADEPKTPETVAVHAEAAPGELAPEDLETPTDEASDAYGDESAESETVEMDAVEAETPESISEASALQDDAPEEAATADEAHSEKPKKARSRSKKKPAEAEESVPEEAVSEPADVNGTAPTAEAAAETKKHWYVIKVTSNREESIKSAIERRVKIEGLEEFFGQIVIPVERITQVKKVVEKKKDTGEKVTKEKRVTKENKKYPGYLFAEVEFNDRILYLFRETSGVGDFVGASQNRPPTPMTDKEVNAMLHNIHDPKDKKGPGGKTVVKLDFEKGDKVRIREGAFANSEGEVKLITDPKDTGDTPKVTVVVTIWGRPVDVELDYWQVDKI